MCGIFGVINFEGKKLPDNYQRLSVAQLLRDSSRRGRDSSGVIGVNKSDKVEELKMIGNGIDLLKSRKYKDFANTFGKYDLITGHTRLATNGSVENTANFQPMVSENIVLAHNGIITNFPVDEEVSDSRKLLDEISKNSGKNIEERLANIWEKAEGSITVSVFDRTTRKLILATNNGSLYLVIDKKNGVYFFASERIFLKNLEKKLGIFLEIEQVLPNTGVVIDLKNRRVKKIKLKPFKRRAGKSKNVWSKSKEGTLFLANHKIDENFVDEIRRCKKCILPDTTPNISFDEKGVCNYCREHQPIKVKGSDALKRLVEPYRSKNGEVDCILAFSGGRDSSYGLHYLVKELKMKPVVVTFDWGMTSDIGRRNQAIMVGALGVEHIVVAADIRRAREDIRKNLLAWIKKPDLGMVPLLMEGDKTTEYYVDKIRKELGVKLVFFCRGNELEKEEFKSGYCGIKNADPGGVIHNYAVFDKFRLLLYYVSRFLTNPGYINSSLWNSFLGYLVTFVVPHDYIYLWHYIPWNDHEILSTLFNIYGWEKSNESSITWRIDDGSPAFYNYLYYQMQGFTENDSFRSRQIREGILSRKKALEIVKRENKVRYQALDWYFKKLGVDGNMVLDVIDKAAEKFRKKYTTRLI